MKKVFILLSLLLITTTGLFAQKYMTLEELRNMNKKKKEVKKDFPKDKVPKDVKVKPRSPKTIEIKEAEVLDEGSQSDMEKPFIFVARTKEDFALIKNMVVDFSTEKEIDFNKQAVIAVFAGTKNTGGYSITINQIKARIDVSVKSPSKDDIVTMALTRPYKIAVVSVEEENSLELNVSEEFKTEMTTYRVTSGEFEFSGGFIGMEKKFQPEGTISVMKSGDYATFIFDLKGKGEDSNRILNEIASGKSKRNSAEINRLEAGDFINRPHPPLDVSVSFDKNKLSMKFEPGKREYVVSDGYEGRGNLEAVLKN